MHFNARNTPFALHNNSAYREWRQWKLAHTADAIEELIVEVDNPLSLSTAEYTELLGVIRRNNMVIYAGNSGSDPDKSIPRAVAERFGLRQLNHNWLADDDGLTSLTVHQAGSHPHYIPYTNRPINWHTDGYYNPNNAQVHGLLLHCVHRAARGGENALMDHEIAYLLLRDENPDYIEALMQPDAMTIPPGTDMHGNLREAAVGPVFSINTQSGDLHMRYTARRRNIAWKQDGVTRDAVSFLENLLNSDSRYIYRGTLEPGMGLISNNVLHDRGDFSDLPGQPQRLLYRARYFDRIADSGIETIGEAGLTTPSAHKKGGPAAGTASLSEHPKSS